MTSKLEHFLRHNAWANTAYMDFCEQLTEAQLSVGAKGTFGPARETLVHIVANEYGYLGALGRFPTSTPGGGALDHGASFPGWDLLRQHAQTTGNALVAAAVDIPDEAVQEVEFEGRKYKVPVDVPLLQALNHGTEHRGQIAVSLTQAGVTPPTLDSWTYWQSGAR
jgi:uncharacterized damage-inducible protein DinB